MKKILIVAASALCAVAVYVGVNAYANNSQMDLLTQNIEALTRGETDGKYWITTSDERDYRKLDCGHYVGTLTTYVDCLPGGHGDCTPKTYVTIYNNCTCQYAR